MPFVACCRVAPNLPHVVGLAVLFLLLLPLLDGGALGEELVPNSIRLPSIIPKRHGLPSRPTERPVVIISTLDGSIHALEVKTGALRWTLPSEDPVVNFKKPEDRFRPSSADSEEELGGAGRTWGGKEEGKGEDHANDGGKDGGAPSESTDVVRVSEERAWKEDATPHPRDDDFEGFIPVYSGIPGGGFLHNSESGEWKVFERTAEDLVSQSPWYDKASRGIIVGSKETKVLALDPETGKKTWMDEKDDANGSKDTSCPPPHSSTLIITRSMYSIKVRNAGTGAFFWNVSISEFRTHATDSDQVPGEPARETPLLVTSSKGDEVLCFDRDTGSLLWKRTLTAAAVSAHLWERQRAIEIDLHAHDQAELVVASGSTALAAASTVGTVHVHKHDGGMYARLYPPMRVPAHVAVKIVESMDTTDVSKSVQSSQLSTHVEGLSFVTAEALVKRDRSAVVCKPRMPGYPECLIGTYDISWQVGDVPGVPDAPGGGGGLLGRPGDAGANQGNMWGPGNEYLDIVSGTPNRHQQLELLLRMAAQTPALFMGLVLFLILLGWFLGRGGSKPYFAAPPEPREMRISEASSCNSLPDLPDMQRSVRATHLLENGTCEQCNSEDKDSGSLSKATTPGETDDLTFAKVSSLNLSNSSWGERWGDKSENGGKNLKNSHSFSYTDSDSDQFNAESIDQFPNELKDVICNGPVSIGSSRGSSRMSNATTTKEKARGAKKGQGKGKTNGKHNPRLYIPDPVWGAPDMKTLCAELDNDSSFGGSRRTRGHSYAALSRDGSDDYDDECDRRPRSISLGSHLSAKSKSDLQNDLDAALAACNSAPNSPKTTPAIGNPMSPGFPMLPQWIPSESKYQSEFIELGRIGKGAFGSVYRVKHRMDEREYAVKKVRLETELESADNQRITREVRSFSILSDHPKIVRYYGTWKGKEMPQNDGQGSINGDPSEVTWDASSMFGDESEMTSMGVLEPVNWLYIQMELCSTSLRQLLNDTGKDHWSVDRDTIRRYLHDVAEGLSYIHSKQYIHRDMKPDNIFIVNNHGTRVAKLGDFGLSCKTNPEKADGGNADGHNGLIREGSDAASRSKLSALSCSGSISDDAASHAELTRACGTRMYFSPELEHSGVYNQLVDVYALGIVMFEMMHIFKTGMERIKVIEQLKGSMCTAAAVEFSALPLSYILVHSDPLMHEHGKRPTPSNSKPSTPLQEKPVRRARRPFERGDDSDSGADSPSSPVVTSRPAGQSPTSTPGMPALKGKFLTPLDTKLGQGSPGPASPAMCDDMTKNSKARSDKLRTRLQGMPLPSEAIVLFENFEYEVCLLLRLLSQAPERRPSARDMRDDLHKSIERDRALDNAHCDDKGQEVQKLKQELSELKAQLGEKGAGGRLESHRTESMGSPPKSPASRPQGLRATMSEADLRLLSASGSRGGE